MDRAPKTALGLLLLLVTFTACSAPKPRWADLPLVPRLDLSAAEAGAREQLEKERSDLDALLADPAAAPAPVAEAFGNLGLLYVTYEFLDAAQVCFENAGRVAPEDYRWTYLAGYLHRIRGRLDRAASAFEESLRLRPDYLPAILRLGQVRAEQGEPEAAEALYRRALELEPQASPAYEGLGNLAAARGDDAAAVEAYEKAVVSLEQFV